MAATTFIERRELAHRTNDGIEVTLFWNKPSNRVTIAVLDTHSAEAFEFEIDGGGALDAFNHPFAYATTHRAGDGRDDRRAADRPTVRTDR